MTNSQTSLPSPWRFLLVATCFLFSACTTPAPPYKYQATATDPVISMESDYELHTDFLVNQRNPAANRCEDFENAGYLQKVDSIFISSKSNKEIIIRSAAGKPITISAKYSFYDPGQSASCGPSLRTFTPASGGKYVARMNALDGACRLTVDRIDDKTQGRETVPSIVQAKCIK